MNDETPRFILPTPEPEPPQYVKLIIVGGPRHGEYTEIDRASSGWIDLTSAESYAVRTVLAIEPKIGGKGYRHQVLAHVSIHPDQIPAILANHFFGKWVMEQGEEIPGGVVVADENGQPSFRVGPPNGRHPT